MLRDVFQTIDGIKYMWDNHGKGLYLLEESGWWTLVIDGKLKTDILDEMGYAPPLPLKKTINQKLMDAF